HNSPLFPYTTLFRSSVALSDQTKDRLRPRAISSGCLRQPALAAPATQDAHADQRGAEQQSGGGKRHGGTDKAPDPARPRNGAGTPIAPIQRPNTPKNVRHK